MTLTWVDSEQVLHAKQAIVAYEADRAMGNTDAALAHLAIAGQAILRAWVAVSRELHGVKSP